jgi:acyl transferase domain-containing protein/acyl carrier protein
VRKREPIAIVGMACRFPSAPTLADYWSMLRNGVDAVRPVPPGRWNMDDYFDPDGAAPGKTFAREAGFLDEIFGFDWRAFGISPREARLMDPQHRLGLELAWEALEDAGLPFEAVAGTRTGVFVGIMWADHLRMLFRDAEKIDPYTITGNQVAYAPNRISFHFDLKGPSVAIDVACASALTALHAACSSLQQGEADVALAGAVNVMVAPENFVAMTKGGLLSPRARCRLFDESADGIARGEGAGVVVLKRLDDALAAGDRIHAVVRGASLNNNGHGSWIMAVDKGSQEALIHAGLAAAGIDASELDYVELHGTGTRIGDPVESAALGAVLASGRKRERACIVGSVKTNMGHLESAGGAAHLIKVVLSMMHGEIPPSLHLEHLNPKIDMAELGISLQQQVGAWPETGRARTAGITSLSLGGSNAFVVLQGSPESASHERTSSERDASPRLIPLSALSHGALAAGAANLARMLDGSSAWDVPALDDVAFTTARRRSHHRQRAFAVGRSHQELVAALDGVARDASRAPAVRGAASHARGSRGPSPRIAFIFSGQGSQWSGMGRVLWKEQRVFREALERCDAAIRALADWSLLDELGLKDPQRESRLDHTDLAQPAIFAIQVALLALWDSWGIRPNVLVGHSVGEVAAAFAAGVLGFEDAVRVIVTRGKVMAPAYDKGRMLSAKMTLADAHRFIEPYGGTLWAAASNGPTDTVLSGDADAIDRAATQLEQGSIPFRHVRNKYAFHSHHMDPFVAEMRQQLLSVAPTSATVPLISTVTGNRCTGMDLDAEYWAHQLRRPVLFSAAIQEVEALGCDAYLEIGPHAVLMGSVRQILGERAQSVALVGSMTRDQDDHVVALKALGSLYAAGAAPDWSRIVSKGSCISLPPYAWQREQMRVKELYEARSARTASALPAAGSRWRDGVFGVEWIECSAKIAERRPSSSVVFVAADEGARADAERWGGDVITATGDHWREALAQRVREGRGDVAFVVAPSDVAAAKDVCASLLAVVQTLAEAATGASKLFVITRGAQSIRGEAPVSLAGAAAWGFGRVVAREQPERWGGLLDLPGTGEGMTDAVADAIALLRSGAEDELGWRGNWWSPRVTRHASSSTPSIAFKADATYLVTGGLTGIGLALAEWAVGRGARHLVLLGRRAPGDDAARTLETLRAAGAEVSAVSCDVADKRRLADVLEEVGVSMPPLRGVFHAAGIVDDALLSSQTAERLAEVMRPKVDGALHLHALTRDLDWFVTFSSLSALAGPPGQAGYAAANAFLDALAQRRRSDGLPGLSIDWGAWSGVGMVDDRILSRWRGWGVDAFSPAEILAALEHLMSVRPRSQMAVCSLDEERFSSGYLRGRRGSLWATFGGDARTRGSAAASVSRAASSATRGAAALSSILPGAAPAERIGLTMDHVRDAVAEVLGLPNSEAIDEDTTFTDLGIDSLMGEQLRSGLSKSVGRKLPDNVIFEENSVSRLARFIEIQWITGAEEATPAAPRHVAPPVEPEVPQEVPGLAIIRSRIPDLERATRLSPSLEIRYLFLVVNPGKGVFTSECSCTLVGSLDVPALRQSFDLVIARHVALRTSIHHEGLPEPLEVVEPPRPVPLSEADLRDLEPAARSQRLAELQHAEFAALSQAKAPPFRVLVARVGDDRFELIWTLSSFMIDASAIANLAREVFSIYHAKVTDQPLDLPPPVAPPKNGVGAPHGPSAADDYFRKELAGAPPKRPLAAELSRMRSPLAVPEQEIDERTRAILAESGLPPQMFAYEPPTSHSVMLAASLSRALRASAGTYRVTPTNFLQAAWALALMAETGLRDVVMANEFTGRMDADKEAIGFLNQTFPLRVRLEEGDQVGPWLRAVHAKVMEIQSFNGQPFDISVADPNIDTIFTSHTSLASAFADGNVTPTLRRCNGRWRRSTITPSLTVAAVLGRNRTTVTFAYTETMYDPALLAQTFAQYFELLDALVSSAPERSVLELLESSIRPNGLGGLF